MDYWGISLNVLQVASILAAACFAAYGLGQKVRDDDGKITRAGRIALTGIVASAILSLGTQSVKAENDRRGANKARAERQADLNKQIMRFNEQARALEQLSRAQQTTLAQTRTIQANLDRSLASLSLLQAQANVTIGAIETVRRRQDFNTVRMLRTMWGDANRISASSLQLAVRYSCGPVFGQTPFPPLMASNVTATVVVATPEPSRRFSLPDRTFASRALLRQEESYVEFESIDQHVSMSRRRTVDGDSVDQISLFRSFNADDLKGFDDPGPWRDAAVEVLLEGRGETGFGAAEQALQELDAALEDEEERLEALREVYDVGEPWTSGGDFSVRLLNCPVSMTLFVNGRIVATAEGRLTRVSQGDEDVDTLVILKFPVVRANPTAFPRFDQVAGNR